MPLQPHNMTDDEILTEAENRYPADPLVSALVKMAAGEQAERHKLRDRLNDYAMLGEADDLKTHIQNLDEFERLTMDATGGRYDSPKRLRAILAEYLSDVSE